MNKLTKLNECNICKGAATVRQCFGLGLQPKYFWVECGCGLRTPPSEDVYRAMDIWNHITNVTYNPKNISSTIQKSNTINNKNKTKIKSIKPIIKEENKISNKPKRKRRTKLEMELFRKNLEKSKK